MPDCGGEKIPTQLLNKQPAILTLQHRMDRWSKNRVEGGWEGQNQLSS